MRVVLHWFRRDLRLADNTALAEATHSADAVVPIFVVDRARLADHHRVAPARVAVLAAALADLAAELARLGTRLLVRIGEPAGELARLAAELDAEAVYANRDEGRQAWEVEQTVAQRLAADGRALHLRDDLGVLPPDALTTSQGKPYTVYTPYARRWRELVASAPPADRAADEHALRASNELVASQDSAADDAVLRAAGFERDHWFMRWSGGRATHLAQLQTFIAERLAGYDTARDWLAEDGTSRLSAALRRGTLSARECLRAAQGWIVAHPEVAAGAETWIGELAWADFFRAVLRAFPHSERAAFRSGYAGLVWPGLPEHLEAWRAGRTGYPIVDAAMRQLASEGWMHNRGRLIVASFLVKDLLIDWREGEAHFMRHLVDGDVSANVGNWQWVASTGTDAQPYFRIFNPVSQGQRFDPLGVYVRRYVPELAHLPDRAIHHPWTLPAEEQRRAGCLVGRDYPAPIVDHARQRTRALALFRGPIAPASATQAPLEAG